MRRRLKLGIVNIMPNARNYERLLLGALGDVAEQVDVRMIHLATHAYASSTDIGDSYSDVQTVMDRDGLDLMIITGAPVEDIDFESIRYWPELMRVMAYADDRLQAVLGICFGGLALARYLGADKRVLGDKLFGSFPLTAACAADELDPTAWQQDMYFSTWAVLDPTATFLQRARVSAMHPSTGPAVAHSHDRRITMVMGHPEYVPETLHDEWIRDCAKGIGYTAHHDDAYFESLRRRHALVPTNLVNEWLRSQLALHAKGTSTREDVHAG